MKYFITLFVALFLTSPVYAQTSISSLCTKLTQHQPDSDVTYQAGVDVNGNAVVPADINAGYQPNTNFEIPVTVDLAERLDIDIDGLELKPSFGTLVYTGDNRVMYEGQDITNRALYLCEDKGTTYSTNAEPEIIETKVVEDTQIVVQPDLTPLENNSAEIIEGDYGQDTINVIYND